MRGARRLTDESAAVMLRAARSGRIRPEDPLLHDPSGFPPELQSRRWRCSQSAGHRVHLAFDGPPRLASRAPWTPSASATRRSRTVRHLIATTPGRRSPAPPGDPQLPALSPPALPQGDPPRERALVSGRSALCSKHWHARQSGGGAASGCSTACSRASSASSRAAARSSASSASSEQDVVLLTPVVDFNTPQLDQLKAAQALGIRPGSAWRAGTT